MIKTQMPPNQQVEKKSILVADDEEMICNLLSKALSKDGYQVTTSSNGREVLENLQIKPEISLVIMDINMPEVTGLQALSTMRTKGLQVPVIMVTGENCNRALEEARRLNAFAYLTKPFELKELKKLAKEALESQ